MCFAQFAAQVGGQLLLRAAQLEQDGGQRLADLVVQLLRDAQALGLVRRQHAAGGLALLALQPCEHLVERRRELPSLGVRPGIGDPLPGAGDVDPASERRQLLQRRHEAMHQ